MMQEFVMEPVMEVADDEDARHAKSAIIRMYRVKKRIMAVAADPTMFVGGGETVLVRKQNQGKRKDFFKDQKFSNNTTGCW